MNRQRLEKLSREGDVEAFHGLAVLATRTGDPQNLWAMFRRIGRESASSACQSLWRLRKGVVAIHDVDPEDGMRRLARICYETARMAGDVSFALQVAHDTAPGTFQKLRQIAQVWSSRMGGGKLDVHPGAAAAVEILRTGPLDPVQAPDLDKYGVTEEKWRRTRERLVDKRAYPLCFNENYDIDVIRPFPLELPPWPKDMVQFTAAGWDLGGGSGFKAGEVAQPMFGEGVLRKTWPYHEVLVRDRNNTPVGRVVGGSADSEGRMHFTMEVDADSANEVLKRDPISSSVSIAMAEDARVLSILEDMAAGNDPPRITSTLDIYAPLPEENDDE